MSLEITLYTKTGSKRGLIKFLTENGFNKSKHFIESMNTPLVLHYHWFGYDNYESFDGVEATLYKASPETKQEYSSTDWILHTRTRASASYEDKQKQNEVIRKARQQFGGTFYNDWYGTNTYTNLADYKKYSALEKNISIIATDALKRLDQIRNCLAGYRNETSEMLQAGLSNLPEDLKSLRSGYIRNDPSIVLYNGLLPFLVSVIEFFFSQCFSSYLRYDLSAKGIIASNDKMKISLLDVMRVVQKESSLEYVITQTFNFQNIESINKAYKTYTTIDILSVLSKKKKIGGKIFRILSKVDELLQARHRFVHELDINYEVTKECYLIYVSTTEEAIKMMFDAFKAHGLKNIEIMHGW